MRSEFLILSRAPFTFTVAGARFTVPYRCAGEWIEAFTVAGMVAGALADPEDRSRLMDLAMERPGVKGELERESFRILSERTGRKWWEAQRLLATSAAPEVLGRLVLAGVDPWSRTIGEWCAATYAVCAKGQDQRGRIKLDFALSIPPEGYEEEWDDGNDVAAISSVIETMMGG